MLPKLQLMKLELFFLWSNDPFFLIYEMIRFIRGLAIYFALLVNFRVLCLIVCHLEILTK